MRTQQHPIHCPHCGRHQYVTLDPSAGDQDYVEDCQGCCSPMYLSMRVDLVNHSIELLVGADDEQYY